MAVEPTEPTEPTEPPAPAEPPDEPSVPPRWGLGDAALAFFVGLLLSLSISGVWLLYQDDHRDLNIAGEAVTAIGFWSGLVGFTVLATRRKGSGSLARDFGLRFERADPLIGLGVGIGAQLLLIPGIALLLRPLIGEPEVSGPVQDLIERADGLRLIGVFLFVTVGAPLVEELFFRGLLLRSLIRRLGLAAAIPVCGILFGVAHSQELPGDALFLVMVSLSALGMVFSWLAIRFGRIGPSVVAHGVFNAWTLILLAT